MNAARQFAAILLAAALVSCSAAEELRFLSWNVESDGNDPAVIAQQLADLGRYNGYCLQEVRPSNIGRYAAATREKHGNSYKYIASSTGRSDRLMIVIDEERLQLVDARELFRHGEHHLNDWRHRSTLALLLREVESGEEFFLVTVHLARGNADLRTEQATGLREWAKSVGKPVVAIGDFNFDFDFEKRKGNAAFEAIVDDDTFHWVQPSTLIDTNWSDRNGDGKDDYPDSCLDFCFLHLPVSWPLSDDVSASAGVVVRDGDFPDDERTSDHRPVEMTLAW